MADCLPRPQWSLAKRRAALPWPTAGACAPQFIECEDFFPEAAQARELIGEVYAVECRCLIGLLVLRGGPPSATEEPRHRLSPQAWAVSTRALPRSGQARPTYMGGLWTGSPASSTTRAHPPRQQRRSKGIVLGRRNHPCGTGRGLSGPLPALEAEQRLDRGGSHRTPRRFGSSWARGCLPSSRHGSVLLPTTCVTSASDPTPPLLSVSVANVSPSNRRLAATPLALGNL